MSEVHLVVNPAAGAGRFRGRQLELRNLVERAGATVTTHEPQSPDHAARLFSELAASNVERVIVAGGDGTVHLAAQALTGSSTVLGVLPVGSGNDFARALGLPGGDPAAAVRHALGRPIALDVLRSAHGVVVSVATAGFSARVNERGNRLRLPDVASRFRYQLATVVELRTLVPSPIRIELDDEPPIELDATLLAVANTAYFGGAMAICPDADPTDGVAELTVVGPTSRREFLRTVRRVMTGTHLSHPAVSTFRARRVRLLGDDLAVWGDGEPHADADVTLWVDAGALAVAAPVWHAAAGPRERSHDVGSGPQ
ncbi:MAG: diacylglycerol kinase family lipid kinase [Acidimicrobiia bacterium]|nr:diacylglycerol kinase family lipid kinase [Acidimicrobiia bacterium]